MKLNIGDLQVLHAIHQELKVKCVTLLCVDLNGTIGTSAKKISMATQ